MNICLRHGQAYPRGSYCPYCGAVPMGVTTGRTDQAIVLGGGWTLAECHACKHADTSAAHTCGLRDALVCR